MLVAFAFLRRAWAGKVEVRDHTLINSDLRGHFTRFSFD